MSIDPRLTRVSDAKPLNVSAAIHEENKAGETSQPEHPIPINSTNPSTNSQPPKSQLPIVPKNDGGAIAEGRLNRPESILNDAEPGALDDLLNDYGYTSQPTTPASPTARFPSQQTLESKSPSESEDPATSSIYTSNVTNIRRIDADSTAAKGPMEIPTSHPIQSAPEPVKDDAASSFATDVLKALDTPEKSKQSSTTAAASPPTISTYTQESISQ